MKLNYRKVESICINYISFKELSCYWCLLCYYWCAIMHFWKRTSKIIMCLCSNNVDDIMQVEFLALCQHLTRLTFEGNPLCVTPHPSAADVSCYVTFIKRCRVICCGLINWCQCMLHLHSVFCIFLFLLVFVFFFFFVVVFLFIFVFFSVPPGREVGYGCAN